MTVHKRLAILTLILCLALSMALSHASAERPVIDINQWNAELEAFVSETGVRQSFTEGELKAMRYLTGIFEGMGYSFRNDTLQAQWMCAPLGAIRKLGWRSGMTNLIAVKKAANPDPAILVVSAHYDSMYGTVGAKDNGSGVAALLTLARAFAQTRPYPDTEIRFVAFAAEEKGKQGSGFFSMELTPDELERLIGVINIDLITLDEAAQNIALSCNTLGGWDGGLNAYVAGEPSSPVHNRISLAFERAFWEEAGCYTGAQRNQLFYIPRHVGDGDHVPFHQLGVDAATICFQGNDAIGGAWPADMHTPEDVIKPFDQTRTAHALNVIYRTVRGLAEDHDFGQR